MTRLSFMGTSAVSALVACASPSGAQTVPAESTTTSPPADIGATDIVVTAQKRAESVQRVPITISAFTGAMLTQANVLAVTDLPRLVPTLKLGTTPGGTGTRYVIRGIGSYGNSALEPSVASFVDGIYIPRPAALVGTFLDVEAVEVLSGPQGTLFGRNASAGAINIRTGTPQFDLSGSGRVEIGTGQLYKAGGYVNLPVNDKVAVRVAGLVSRFGGYWKNTNTDKRFGGLDTEALRVSIKAKLTDTLVWNLKGDYERLHGNGYINYALVPSTLTPTTLTKLTALNNGIAPDLNEFDRKNNVASDTSHINDKFWGGVSDLALTLGGNYTIRLLQGYHDWKAVESEGDAGGLAVYTVNRDVLFTSKSYSNELQVISPRDALLDGRLSFVAGLYQYHEKLGINYSFNINRAGGFCDKLSGMAPALAAIYASCQVAPEKGLYGIHFQQTTNSVAAYGQSTFAILPTLDLTLGLRWTRDKKQASYVAGRTALAGILFGANETTPGLRYDDDRLTYRASLNWKPSRDVLVFANYSTGFKSGGFNSGSAPTVQGLQRLFGPETTRNYELGWKTQLLDRKATFNTTFYRMDVAGFQETAANGLGGSTLRNVGKLRQQGADVELAVVPTSSVRANVVVAYLDSKFLSYRGAPTPPYVGGFQDLTGYPTTYSPRWSISSGLDLKRPIGSGGMHWLLHGDVAYSSTQHMGSQIDNSALTIQRRYALLGARATLSGRDDRWSVALYGRNLTDKGYCSAMIYNQLDAALGLRYPGGTAVRCTVAAPRTLGIVTTAKF